MRQVIIWSDDDPDPWAIYVDGLVQDCSIPIADALGILQSFTKTSICVIKRRWINWTRTCQADLRLASFLSGRRRANVGPSTFCRQYGIVPTGFVLLRNISPLHYCCQEKMAEQNTKYTPWKMYCNGFKFVLIKVWNDFYSNSPPYFVEYNTFLLIISYHMYRINVYILIILPFSTTIDIEWYGS